MYRDWYPYIQDRKITNPNAKIMAVVKADAYGHGFLEVAKTLLENGADRLAVAVLQEGKQLRSRGVTVPILILGASGEEAVEDLINFDITPSVFTYEFAKALSYEAERKEKITKIHIKIDTGMSRIAKVYTIYRTRQMLQNVRIYLRFQYKEVLIFL